MQKVENDIKDIFAKADLGIWPEGQVKCSMSAGSIGYAGSIVSGLIRKTKKDITQILGKLDLEYGDDLSSKLLDLREESKHETLGPIYSCDINIKGKKVDFKYFWEGTPFQCLSEVEPNIHGS